MTGSTHRLVAGDLAAVFLPDRGMLGASLQHRGEEILQRVDDPNRPLRARARLLISMCLPDMLPPGKAVEAARVRVANYLRQPDFTTQVVADLTEPAEKEKALRELFDLMKRAGFKVG